MKLARVFFGCLLLGGVVLISTCEDMYSEGANTPVIAEETLADPHAIKYQGRYYLYGTAGVSDHFDVFVSDDGKRWDKKQTVFNKKTDILWAPDVFEDPKSGKFYLYYSLDFSIGVAEADTPLGPFKDLGMLVEDAIDAFVFSEGDNYYLYYATAGEGFKNLNQMGERMFKGMIDTFLSGEEKRIKKKIYVQEMKSPTELIGERRELIEAADEWERGYSLQVVEGPWVLKEKDTYYLMYSGSPTHESKYAIGYATADNPMGPFHKSADNPILYSAEDTSVFGKKVYGPGHHSVVREEDGKNWIYFHQNEKAFNLGMGSRYTARGELIITDAGKMVVHLGEGDASE